MDTYKSRLDSNPTDFVSIADLDPSVEPPRDRHLDAVVTLVWPYSSSTCCTSLLLAEPDFRLRTRKGQVRINFKNASARRVATSGVGIGDRVRLWLRDAVWSPPGTVISTPGRSVEGELVFSNRLDLHAKRSNQILSDLHVEEEETPSPPLSTPTSLHDAVLKDASRRIDEVRRKDHTWSTPVVIRPSDSGAAFFYTGDDTYAEEDGHIPGRGKKRTLFGRRSGQWKYSREDRGESVQEGVSPFSNSSSRQSEENPSEALASQDLSADQAPQPSAQDTNDDDLPVLAVFTGECGSAGPQQVQLPSSILSFPALLSECSANVDKEQPLLTTSSPRGARAGSPSSPNVRLSTPISSRPEQTDSHPISQVSRSNAGDLESTRYQETLRASPEADPIGKRGRPEKTVSSTITHSDAVEGSPAASEGSDHVSSDHDCGFGNDCANFSRARVEPSEVSASSNAIRSSNFVDPVSLYQELSHSPHQSVEQETAGPAHDVPDSNITGPATIYTSNTHLLIAQQRQAFQEGVEHGNGDTVETSQTRSKGMRIVTDDVEDSSYLYDQFLAHSPMQGHCSDSNKLRSLRDESVSPARSRSRDENHEISPQNAVKGQISRVAAIPEQTSQVSSEEAISSSPHLSTSRGGGHSLNSLSPSTPSPMHSNPEEMSRSPSPKSTAELKVTLPQKRESDAPVTAEDQEATGSHRGAGKSELRRHRRRNQASDSKEIPDIISPWFGLRRSSRYRRLSKKAEENEAFATLVRSSVTAPSSDWNIPVSSDRVLGSDSTNQQSEHQRMEQSESLSLGTDFQTENERSERQENGDKRRECRITLESDLADYLALSSLGSFRASSDSQGPISVDIIAAVSSGTSKPKQAKKGPRDHNVVFHVCDQHIHTQSVQVQCFRPFPKSLPSADVGDVINLRNFIVKSQNRKCFLLSSGSSGWHVWRFNKRASENIAQNRPKEDLVPSSTDNVVQECNGPPVELTSAEHQFALDLRSWWLSACELHGAEHGSSETQSKL